MKGLGAGDVDVGGRAALGYHGRGAAARLEQIIKYALLVLEALIKVVLSMLHAC